MDRIVKPPTGAARYKDGILTITTQAKRGKKIVPKVSQYFVTDLNPDKRVANPAYRLTKVEQVGVVGEGDPAAMGPLHPGDAVYRKAGEVYDVHVDRFGPACSCPHAIFRGGNSRIPCKHALAMQAVGLLRKQR